MNAAPAPDTHSVVIRGTAVGLLRISLSACAQDEAAPEPAEEVSSHGPEADDPSFVTLPDLAPTQIEFTDGPAADQRAGEDEYYFLSPS